MTLNLNKKNQKVSPEEFGGVFGVSLIATSSLLAIFSLHTICNASHCSFTQFPTNLSRFSHISTYYNPKTYLGFLAYATFLALVSILPFGGRKLQALPAKKETCASFTYVMNGCFSFSLLLALGVGLEMENIPISEFILLNFFQLLCVSTLFGLFLAIYAFTRSFYVDFSALNLHAVGKKHFYAFFMGREVSPRVFGLLDLKMYVNRLALTGTILVDFAFLYQSTTRPGNNATLILIVAMHFIYLGDGLLYENAWISSFEIQYEGFGFMGGVGYAIYPFIACSVTKYVADYNVNLPPLQLGIISVIFATGYVFFRGANNQKDAFRKNPDDPALAHLETFATRSGKKLLCSGFWGIVRHPNYLGDILMHLSFGLFVLDVPPVITSVSIVVLLVHRSVRDNARCKEKYGGDWDEYCGKVRFVLLPNVY